MNRSQVAGILTLLAIMGCSRSETTSGAHSEQFSGSTSQLVFESAKAATPEPVSEWPAPSPQSLQVSHQFVTNYDGAMSRVDRNINVNLSPTSGGYTLTLSKAEKPNLHLPTLPKPSFSAFTELLRRSKAFIELHNHLSEVLPGHRRSPIPPSAHTADTGRGIWDPEQNVVATYANQTIYPNFQFSSKSALYAPTMMSGHQACIEVTTAYGSGAPQIWFWDWCGKVQEAKNIIDASSSDFIAKYVRNLGLGPNVGQYTVQTSRLPDGRTWVAKLYNYRDGRWEEHFRSTYPPESNENKADRNGTGWDFFEEHAYLISDNNGHNEADYCPSIPRLFETTDLKVSSDGKRFYKMGPGALELDNNQLTCASSRFAITNPYWQWMVVNKH